jgi:hypothetical protein
MEGFKTLCSKESNGCCMQNGGGGRKCCKEYEIKGTELVADVLFEESEFLPYDPTMEIIFPPQLQVIELKVFSCKVQKLIQLFLSDKLMFDMDSSIIR